MRGLFYVWHTHSGSVGRSIHNPLTPRFQPLPAAIPGFIRHSNRSESNRCIGSVLIVPVYSRNWIKEKAFGMAQDRLTRCIGRFPWIAVLVLLLINAERSQAQKVDLNGNGSSDVWELIYNSGSLLPDADA